MQCGRETQPLSLAFFDCHRFLARCTGASNEKGDKFTLLFIASVVMLAKGRNKTPILATKENKTSIHTDGHHSVFTMEDNVCLNRSDFQQRTTNTQMNTLHCVGCKRKAFTKFACQIFNLVVEKSVVS